MVELMVLGVAGSVYWGVGVAGCAYWGAGMAGCVFRGAGVFGWFFLCNDPFFLISPWPCAARHQGRLPESAAVPVRGR